MPILVGSWTSIHKSVVRPGVRPRGR
jgi:hypothetical protein